MLNWSPSHHKQQSSTQGKMGRSVVTTINCLEDNLTHAGLKLLADGALIFLPARQQKLSSHKSNTLPIMEVKLKQSFQRVFVTSGPHYLHDVSWRIHSKFQGCMPVHKRSTRWLPQEGDGLAVRVRWWSAKDETMSGMQGTKSRRKDWHIAPAWCSTNSSLDLTSFYLDSRWEKGRGSSSSSGSALEVTEQPEIRASSVDGS